jgi:hypothetical protein
LKFIFSEVKKVFHSLMEDIDLITYDEPAPSTSAEVRGNQTASAEAPSAWSADRALQASTCSAPANSTLICLPSSSSQRSAGPALQQATCSAPASNLTLPQLPSSSVSIATTTSHSCETRTGPTPPVSPFRYPNLLCDLGAPSTCTSNRSRKSLSPLTGNMFLATEGISTLLLIPSPDSTDHQFAGFSLAQRRKLISKAWRLMCHSSTVTVALSPRFLRPQTSVVRFQRTLLSLSRAPNLADA